ncbi:hypothetical protein BY996DRAFT_6526099 [Phakopsora pachyrhizi]|nr:hypothetical protein BY996DRAFT_6526099 [Phakopsora pachyrhizi]
MPRPQRNPSGHLTTEDYSIICMWLSKPSNFSASFGQAGKTTICSNGSRSHESTLASSYREFYKSKVEGTSFHVYMFLLDTNCIYIFRKKECEVTKLNWEQQKWHLEKEQKDKEQHMELTIRENKIQFAKDGKDKELKVRMLIAEKDYEAIKLKEDNALLLAVVGSSRSIEEITKISKILLNR